jgi:hypothetical protein
VKEVDPTADNVWIFRGSGMLMAKKFEKQSNILEKKIDVENDLYADLLKFRVLVTGCWESMKEYINKRPCCDHSINDEILRLKLFLAHSDGVPIFVQMVLLIVDRGHVAFRKENM